MFAAYRSMMLRWQTDLDGAIFDSTKSRENEGTDLPRFFFGVLKSCIPTKIWVLPKFSVDDSVSTNRAKILPTYMGAGWAFWA